jgi:hypothetical protein
MQTKLFILGKTNKIPKIRKRDLVITFDFDTKNLLEKKGVTSLPVKKYVSKNIIKIGMDWLKKWSDEKSVGDYSFKEFCMYRGISFWWFCDTFLWYHNLHNKNFYSLFYYTDIILKIIEKNEIKEIVSYKNNKFIENIIKEISKIHKIKTKIDSERIKSKIKDKSPIVVEKLKGIKFKIRKKISRKIIKKVQKKDILFTTYTSLYKKGEDIFLKDITNKLDYSNYYSIDLDYTRDIKNINEGIKSRKNRNYLPFEYFSSDDKIAKRIFKKRWNKIKNNKEFQKSLTYKNIPLWNIMESQFKFTFLERLPEAANYIRTSENMLKRLKPKVVFMIDETFMYGRSIIHAAKLTNTKTIALQHGLISQQSFEYLNKKEKNNKLSPPLPDKMLVIGEYSKNLLTNKNYKEIIICGQPRYESFKKKQVKTKDKRIVLISQPLTEESSGDYVETAFEAFREINSKKKDIKFTIKVHPREESLEYYQRLAKKNKIEIEIIRDIPINLVIERSSAIITMHSAVGLEALMLEKPLIILLQNASL